jgi:hypothetical protein
MSDDAAAVLRERAWATGFATTMLALVLGPLVTRSDSFPLSDYPMFSSHRENASARVTHVVAHSTAGNHRPVPPRMLGTKEIMQAHQTAVVAAKDPATAAELCDRVAANVAEDGEAWSDVDRLELRADRYDAVVYWQGEHTPVRSHVYASCPVPRGADSGR